MEPDIATQIRNAVESDPDNDHIQSISLFGSVLHGDSKPESDVDLLLELRKGLGYFKLIAIQNRISDKIGRPVDLLTKQELSPYFRDQVVNEAEVIYRHYNSAVRI